MKSNKPNQPAKQDMTNTQREIKFRAWDKKNKKLVSDFAVSAWGTVFDLDDGTFDAGRMYERTDEYELMQFTGLLDKNGKEIYEGDIVSSWLNVSWENKFTSVVVFAEQGFKMEYAGVSGIYEEINSRDNFEVIGNIYENPELL